MRSFLAFLRLGRLHFLAGGFVLHTVGTAMALYNGAPFNLRVFVLGQIAVTATQLMTHYSNDYFDLAADRANLTPTRWSGGSRVLADEQLPPRTALFTALACASVALIALIILVIEVKVEALAILLILLGLFLAWGYSAPPFRLHSHGLGELSTAILVPGLTPLVGYTLHAGRIDLLPLLAVFPLCCFQFAMLLTIEFPDEQGDTAVGKNTLVVRLGGGKAAKLHRIALLLAYLSLPFLVLLGLPPLAALMLLAFAPLAARQLWLMWHGAWANPNTWNSLGFLSVAILIGSSALELAAFVILIGIG